MSTNDKFKTVFENADKEMNDSLAGKDSRLDISKMEGVYADRLMGRQGRHGFYCWGDLDDKTYGASYDDLGVFNDDEYEKVLEFFREKYPNIKAAL